MKKTNYPTNFFLKLEERLIDTVGISSGVDLALLATTRSICLTDETLLAKGISYKDIHLSLGFSHQNLSQSLKRLENDGFLERYKDDVDGRVIRYRLTHKAWRTISVSDQFIGQEFLRFVIDEKTPN